MTTQGGYEGATRPAERRALFDLRRRIDDLQRQIDAGGGGGGVTDHGALTGLLDDDHPQYLLESRAAYTHVQSTPASVWTINHSLDFVPNVTVVDSAGEQVEGDVDYTSAIQVVLTFSGAFSGIAYLS